MKGKPLAIITLGSMIAFMAASQVLLKLAGMRVVAAHTGALQALLANPWLWLAMLATGAGFFCWLVTLRTLSLAVAYPWTALIYIITPLAGNVLFGEVLTGKYVLGMVSIIAGVLLTTRGVRHHVDG